MRAKGKGRAALVAGTGGCLRPLLLYSRKMSIPGELAWTVCGNVRIRRVLAEAPGAAFLLCIGFRSWGNAMQAVRPAVRAVSPGDCGFEAPIFLPGLLTAGRSVHAGSASRFEVPSWAQCGTSQPFPSDRMIEAVPQLASPQHGGTRRLRARSRSGRAGWAFASLAQEQVKQVNKRCDVSIGHASVGSALRIPVRKEASVLISPHVGLGNHDGHPLQIAIDQASHGPTLPLADDQSAARRRVIAVVPLDVWSTRGMRLRGVA